MNINAIKYYEEMNLNKISFEPLTDDNYHLVEGFSCGNAYFNEFLFYDAMYETSSKIYLIVYDNDTLLGFFGLSATGITTIRESEHVKETFNRPAIEITYFAINNEFKHMWYNEKAKKDGNKVYLSNIIFSKLVRFIQQDVRDILGFEFIILYSVPEAVKFYRKHEFQNFDEYMIPGNKQYLSNCTPMVFTL